MDQVPATSAYRQLRGQASIRELKLVKTPYFVHHPEPYSFQRSTRNCTRPIQGSMSDSACCLQLRMTSECPLSRNASLPTADSSVPVDEYQRAGEGTDLYLAQQWW